MTKNEAIVAIVEQAMNQIFDISQFAIMAIVDPHDTENVGEESTLGERARVTPDENEYTQTRHVTREAVEALATQAAATEAAVTAKPARKPRTPKAEPVTEAEIAPAPELEEVAETDFVEAQTEDDDFPTDLEEARTKCRDLLSKIVSRDGHQKTREAMLEVVGKSRVTDFTVGDCKKFCEAFNDNA